MSLKVVNQGEAVLLGVLRDWLIGNAELHLYVEAHTPADGDEEEDYTEATFPGYAPVALDAWGSVAQSVDGYSFITAATVVFTATDSSSEEVHGYYVTDGDDNLLWAESLPAPISVGAAGSKVNVVPQLSLHSEF